MADTGAWGTTSGLLDDYEHHWEEVWFGFNDKYQEGKALLLHVQGPALQEGEVVEEEMLTMYSCGDGWDAAKGGEEAAHKNGNIKFSDGANVGKLVKSIMDLLGDDLADLAAKGNPTQAKTWRGMQVQMERKAFSYKDRKTGEERTYEVALPVEIIALGEPEEDTSRGRAGSRGKGNAASSTGRAKAATSRTRAQADDVEDDDEVDEVVEAPAKPARKPRASKTKDLRSEVIEFAGTFEENDHGSFLDAVYDEGEFPRANDIDDDEDLSDEILDPDSDLWAEAHA